MSTSSSQRTKNEPTTESPTGEAAINDKSDSVERSATRHAKPSSPQSTDANAGSDLTASTPDVLRTAQAVASELAATPVKGSATAKSESAAAPAGENGDRDPSAAVPARGAAVERGLQYVLRNPFRSIAVATVAGTLVGAELAIALGVVASMTVLLATPNGARKQRELEQFITRTGHVAVAAIRKSFKSPSRSQTPRE